MDLHVLIAGGGIGGLCLAHGLRKLGISVSVYERDASRTERVDMYRLAINPAGSRSLRACLPGHFWERFVATAGKRGGGFGFLDPQLGELVVIENEIMFPPDPAVPSRGRARTFGTSWAKVTRHRTWEATGQPT